MREPSNNEMNLPKPAQATELRRLSRCSADQEARLRRGVFLDLNGTLVAPILVEHPSDLRLIDGVAGCVAQLCRAGFVCPVITVQSRIEKGLFTDGEFRAWFAGFARDLATKGALVVGPYVCPHRFRTPCLCKKPSTLLYEQAAADHDVDLAGSYVIGDSAGDVEAAARFGGRGCLLSTEGPAPSAGMPSSSATYRARTMPEVVEWILSQEAAEQPDAADGASRRRRA